VALAFDIDLKPNVHVYAPGVENYIPIEWKMKESPASRRYDVIMPAPKMLHLPAIDETVPVYTGHFRIVRDITIAADQGEALVDASGQFTVEGTLRYQACDDRVCYVPGAAGEVDVSARGARSRAGARGVAEKNALGLFVWITDEFFSLIL